MKTTSKLAQGYQTGFTLTDLLVSVVVVALLVALVLTIRNTAERNHQNRDQQLARAKDGPAKSLPNNLEVNTSAVAGEWQPGGFTSPVNGMNSQARLEAPTNRPDVFVFNTIDGSATVLVDASAAPDVTDWAQTKLAPVLAIWYPKLVAWLPSEGFTAPSRFQITVKPMHGVAYTVGTNVTVSAQWIRSQMDGEAVGSLVHECVHVVQQYGHSYGGAKAPFWLTEGIADYFRWFKYEPQSHGADLVWARRQAKASIRYDGAYRISANFLNWVTVKYDPDIVVRLNAAMRAGTYSEEIWKKCTGKSVQDLGAEWKKEIEAQLSESFLPHAGSWTGTSGIFIERNPCFCGSEAAFCLWLA